MSSATKTPMEFEVERVVCWLNAWANSEDYRAEGRSAEWLDGYREAAYEAATALWPVVPNWLDTWQERSQWTSLRRTTRREVITGATDQ